MTTPNPISVGFGLYELDCELIIGGLIIGGLIIGGLVELRDKFTPQLPQN